MLRGDTLSFLGSEKILILDKEFQGCFRLLYRSGCCVRSQY